MASVKKWGRIRRNKELRIWSNAPRPVLYRNFHLPLNPPSASCWINVLSSLLFSDISLRQRAMGCGCLESGSNKTGWRHLWLDLPCCSASCCVDVACGSGDLNFSPRRADQVKNVHLPVVLNLLSSLLMGRWYRTRPEKVNQAFLTCKPSDSRRWN